MDSEQTENRPPRFWFWKTVEKIGATMAVAGGFGQAVTYVWGTILWFEESVFLGFLSLATPHVSQFAYGLIYAHIGMIILVPGCIIVCVVGWHVGELGERKQGHGDQGQGPVLI